jgi:hypothetical protein
MTSGGGDTDNPFSEPDNPFRDPSTGESPPTQHAEQSEIPDWMSTNSKGQAPPPSVSGSQARQSTQGVHFADALDDDDNKSDLEGQSFQKQDSARDRSQNKDQVEEEYGFLDDESSVDAEEEALYGKGPEEYEEIDDRGTDYYGRKRNNCCDSFVHCCFECLLGFCIPPVCMFRRMWYVEANDQCLNYACLQPTYLFSFLATQRMSSYMLLHIHGYFDCGWGSHDGSHGCHLVRA